MRRAGPGELDDVLATLDEAAAWLRRRDIISWPPAFRPEWVEDAMTTGEMFLAHVDDVVVGTLSLSWCDPLWADDGQAGYLHRFAVRRAAAGAGRRMLGWVAGAVRARDRGVLRLDCAADNPALRAYYERAGFGWVRDVVLEPTVALWSAPGIRLSLYELPLGRVQALDPA